MKKFFISISAVVLIFCLWQLISTSELVNSILFPPPTKVFSALFEMLLNGTLITDIRDSLWRASIGFIIGSILGIFCGLLTGRSALFSSFFSPLLNFLRSLPPVALVPLVILWFGIGDVAKVFSIAFAVFFPVWVNTYFGAQRIPKVFLWSIKFLKKSPWMILKKVIFPGTLPFIVTGLRNGIALSLIMVFVSELAGASSGIGYRIAVTQSAYRADQMLAALLMLGFFGVLADMLFIFLMRTFHPWLHFHHNEYT